MESEGDPLTRRADDLFEKEPLEGNSEVHLHTPTKFGEDRSKDLGGDREQTDRQTDKRCSIYSMMFAEHYQLIIAHYTALFVYVLGVKCHQTRGFVCYLSRYTLCTSQFARALLL